MISLTEGAAVMLTDSGGVQEETTALGVPCVTLREQTERPVTVDEGTNRLAPWPLDATGIVGAYCQALAQGRSRPGERSPEGWDGRAGERIVAAMASPVVRSAPVPGDRPGPGDFAPLRRNVFSGCTSAGYSCGSTAMVGRDGTRTMCGTNQLASGPWHGRPCLRE